MLRPTSKPVLAVAAVLASIACGNDPSRPTPIAPRVETPVPAPVAQATPPPADPNAVSLAGRYSLTLRIDDCAVLPPEQLVRHYGATVTHTARPAEYVVTLDGSTFLSGLVCTFGSGRFEGMGCDQFFLFEEDGQARFSLENNNDDGHGGHIVEQASDRTWMEIIGEARGATGRWPLEASGAGSLWYCPTPSGYPFPCGAYTSCRPKLSVTLTPQ